jgi:hypothetical protein
MPITVDWDTTEKHAIRMEISGKWNWDDIWSALDEIHALLESVDYTVSIIIPGADVLVRSLPPGLLTQVGALNRRRHPRSGLMIFVDEAETNAGKVWYRMIGAVYPNFYNMFQFVNSHETARRIASDRYQQQMQKSTLKRG